MHSLPRITTAFAPLPDDPPCLRLSELRVLNLARPLGAEALSVLVRRGGGTELVGDDTVDVLDPAVVTEHLW